MLILAISKNGSIGICILLKGKIAITLYILLFKFIDKKYNNKNNLIIIEEFITLKYSYNNKHTLEKLLIE